MSLPGDPASPRTGESHARVELDAEDLAVLAALREWTHWLRGVACTLARRGVAFRIAHPARARAVLDALQAWPLFKAGQFLFDLLEWEDFMLDGPPPPPVPTTMDAHALQRIASLLTLAKSHLDGASAPTEWDGLSVSATRADPDDATLPPLESSFYLYEDVVLGALRSAAPLVAAAERARAHTPSDPASS